MSRGFNLRRRPFQVPGLRALLALGFFCGLALAAPPPGPAYADDLGISAAPSPVEMTLAPGGTASRELSVFNQVRHPIRISASVEQYREGAGVSSAADWLTVEPGSFLVAGFGERTVTVSIEVPEGDLPSGGRYAAVAFDAVSMDPLQDVGATTARTAVPFLINLDGRGPLLREAAVEWFAPVLEPDGLVSFRAQLVNRGNVHIVASGSVEIEGSDGPLPTKQAFAESTTVFPGESYELMAGPAAPLTPGSSYTATANFSFGGAAVVSAGSEFTVTPVLKVTDLHAVERPGLPMGIVVTLVNEGDLALRPRVQVYVHTAVGTVLGTTFDTGPSILLPGIPGDIRFDFQRPLPPGDHKLVAEVYYGAPDRIVEEQPLKTGGTETGDGPSTGETQETEGGAGWYLPAGVAAAVLVLAVAASLTPPFAPVRRKLGNAARALRGKG
jgi:hypothetical protein